MNRHIYYHTDLKIVLTFSKLSLVFCVKTQIEDVSLENISHIKRVADSKVETLDNIFYNVLKYVYLNINIKKRIFFF